MISNFDVVELFKMWEDGQKFSGIELVNDYFEFNKKDFDIDEARSFVNDAMNELSILSSDSNKIVFMTDKLMRDYLCVYSMDDLDCIMNGWSASQVCQYCCHDDFSNEHQFFYFDNVNNIAHSVDALGYAFDEYEDLDDFIYYYSDEFEKFLDEWSDENIEDVERNEYIENEIGNVYMY